MILVDRIEVPKRNDWDARLFSSGCAMASFIRRAIQTAEIVRVRYSFREGLEQWAHVRVLSMGVWTPEGLECVVEEYVPDNQQSLF